MSNNEYITTVHKYDVICGRGSGPSERPGNINFRDIVASRKAEYLAIKPRDAKNKNRVAGEIIDTVRAQGGRFLRIVTDINALTLIHNEGYDEVYCLAEEPQIMEKAKQALRQQKPCTQTAQYQSTVRGGSTVERSNSHQTTPPVTSPQAPQPQAATAAPVIATPQASQAAAVAVAEPVNAHLQQVAATAAAAVAVNPYHAYLAYTNAQVAAAAATATATVEEQLRLQQLRQQEQLRLPQQQQQEEQLRLQQSKELGQQELRKQQEEQLRQQEQLRQEELSKQQEEQLRQQELRKQQEEELQRIRQLRQQHEEELKRIQQLRQQEQLRQQTNQISLSTPAEITNGAGTGGAELFRLKHLRQQQELRQQQQREFLEQQQQQQPTHMQATANALATISPLEQLRLKNPGQQEELRQQQHQHQQQPAQLQTTQNALATPSEMTGGEESPNKERGVINRMSAMALLEQHRAMNQYEQRATEVIHRQQRAMQQYEQASRQQQEALQQYKQAAKQSQELRSNDVRTASDQGMFGTTTAATNQGGRLHTNAEGTRRMIEIDYGYVRRLEEQAGIRGANPEAMIELGSRVAETGGDPKSIASLDGLSLSESQMRALEGIFDRGGGSALSVSQRSHQLDTSGRSRLSLMDEMEGISLPSGNASIGEISEFGMHRSKRSSSGISLPSGASLGDISEFGMSFGMSRSRRSGGGSLGSDAILEELRRRRGGDVSMAGGSSSSGSHDSIFSKRMKADRNDRHVSFDATKHTPRENEAASVLQSLSDASYRSPLFGSQPTPAAAPVITEKYAELSEERRRKNQSLSAYYKSTRGPSAMDEG